MITQKIEKYKIHIGNHPKSRKFGKASISGYNAILNVSDYPPYKPSKKSTEIHWFPIEEWNGWGYSPLYHAVHILDRLIKQKKKIYIHCWAGKHRSVMITYLYLRSLGNSEEEVFKLFDSQFSIEFRGEKRKIKNWLRDIYKRDVKNKRIEKDSIQFMKIVRENPELSILEVLQILKKKTIETDFFVVLGDKNGK